jgi:dimethylhistidine N-methyltransferase
MQHFGVSTTEQPRVAEEVYSGLLGHGQKSLPSSYLYDALGSSLFEAITLLPEYGLTRADFRLIQRHAHEIPDYGGPALVIELGSGSGAKARGILGVLARYGSITFCPIDVSQSALTQSKQALQDLEKVHVVPIEGEYSEGIDKALQQRKRGQTALILFLGSSIGNFPLAEATTLLLNIGRQLRAGDLLLFTVDMEKDEERMIAAYDDPLGVTAAFNLNTLARLNREYGATFDLSRFKHVIHYDKTEQRIEMHLESTADQLVRVGDCSVAFRRGESILTEYSYKFRAGDVERLCDAAGLRILAAWRDSEWPLQQTLCRPRGDEIRP